MDASGPLHAWAPSCKARNQLREGGAAAPLVDRGSASVRQVPTLLPYAIGRLVSTPGFPSPLGLKHSCSVHRRCPIFAAVDFSPS
jgi:hypothetical protein